MDLKEKPTNVSTSSVADSYIPPSKSTDPIGPEKVIQGKYKKIFMIKILVKCKAFCFEFEFY